MKYIMVSICGLVIGWMILFTLQQQNITKEKWVQEFNCKNDFSTKCQLMATCSMYDYPNKLYENKNKCEIDEYNYIKK